MYTIVLYPVILLSFFIFNINLSFGQSTSLDGKVIISISSKKDVVKLKREMCEVKFSILNSSFGTINGLGVRVQAENDRGRKVKAFGVPAVENKKKWRAISIPKGETLINAKGAVFEEECKYLGKIKLVASKITENSCNIRMMPETEKCRDIFILVNEGEDIGVKVANKANKSGLTFLDVGFVKINGKKTSFVDYAAEDPYDLRGKDIVIVGYINRFSEWERHKVWGYRFDLRIFSGEEGQSYAMGGEPYLTALVAPFKSKKYGSNLTKALSNLRKANFKMLSTANVGKALIEVRGKANVFSNTGDLYIQTEKIKIIDKE